MVGPGYNGDPTQAPEPADLSFLRGDPANRVSLPLRGEHSGDGMPLYDYGDETGLDLNTRWQRRKVERNTYLSNLLTDAWPSIDDYRTELTGAGSDLGLQDYDPLRPDGPLTTELMQLSENPARDLGRAMTHTMNRGIRSWFEQRRDRQATLTDAERTYTDTAYGNLAAMLEEFTRRDPEDTPSLDVLSFTCNGVDTAISAIWGVMEVAPQVFASQFQDTPLTGRQLQTIIQNSYSLVVNLAAGNQELSMKTLESLQSWSPSGFPPLIPSMFVLAGEGDRMALHITQEAINRIHGHGDKPVAQITPESPTTGCPALAARTPDGKNLILAMWEWSMRVANQAYFPRFDMNT